MYKLCVRLHPIVFVVIQVPANDMYFLLFVFVLMCSKIINPIKPHKGLLGVWIPREVHQCGAQETHSAQKDGGAHVGDQGC